MGGESGRRLRGVFSGRGALSPVLGALLVAAGCSPAPGPSGAEVDLALPLKELMDHVVQPAAFGVWRGAGWKATLSGEEDLAPRTTDGWTEVENGAATVAEAGALLKLKGRVLEPAADWDRWADALTKAGLAAKAAAEAKDEEKVFAAGVRLEAVCTGCHTRFMPGGEGGPPPTPPPRR
jgi:hypothetical protein